MGSKNRINLGYIMDLILHYHRNGMTLITANDKHYKIIKELEMQVFRP